jgi:hypothetical protein
MFHHDEKRLKPFFDVVDLDDVRMIEFRNGAGFFSKFYDKIRVHGHIVLQHFYGDRFAQGFMYAPVNNAVTAFSNDVCDNILPDSSFGCDQPRFKPIGDKIC